MTFSRSELGDQVHRGADKLGEVSRRGLFPVEVVKCVGWGEKVEIMSSVELSFGHGAREVFMGCSGAASSRQLGTRH